MKHLLTILLFIAVQAKGQDTTKLIYMNGKDSILEIRILRAIEVSSTYIYINCPTCTQEHIDSLYRAMEVRNGLYDKYFYRQRNGKWVKFKFEPYRK